MNQPQDNTSMPSVSSYGFRCALQPQAFAQGVAHEVRQRLERVRAALGRSAC